MQKIQRLILVLAMIGGSIFLIMEGFPFPLAFGVIMAALTLLWIISLFIKDASIIDIFWGPGFVILTWFYYFMSSGPGSFRNVLLCTLVSIWGLRLALHIGTRNIGKGEDFRYQEWRKEGGKNYWWISYLRVFLLQGILLWIISSPLFVAMSDSRIFYVTHWDKIGVLIWMAGIYFEAVGDWQLKKFKSDSKNKGKVMDTGLWKYTRHPNYFGDALIWWGFFFFTFPVEGGWRYIFSPILMTFLLMRISGAALLESSLKETKPGYKEYIEKTSAFFPWFPKK